MESIWTQTARLPAFEPLRSDPKTNVLITGGVTQNTTAEITSRHGLICEKLRIAETLIF